MPYTVYPYDVFPPSSPPNLPSSSFERVPIMAHTVYHGIGANETATHTSRDAMRRARDAT